MWIKYDGLIRKNKTFKYVDCNIRVDINSDVDAPLIHYTWFKGQKKT